MREKRRKIMAATIGGLFIGLFVFLSGFGMMYCLWKMIGTSAGLPGLFDYSAATIGDGICLPIMVGSLLAFEIYNRDLMQNKRTCVITGYLFSLVGLGVQLSWLLSDKTKLNWSIPVLHQFNVAGWYHSIFFIAMFGIVAFHMCMLWQILKNKESAFSWYEINVLLLFVATGSLFIFLFLKDDYSEYCSDGYLFSVATIVIFLLLFLFVRTAARKEILASFMLPLMAGMLGALGIILAINAKGEGNFVLAFGGALGACFLLEVEIIPMKELTFLNLWLFSSGFFLFRGYGSDKSCLEMICLIGVVCSITAVYEILFIRELNIKCACLGSIGLYIIICNDNIVMRQYSKICEFLFLIAIYLVFNREITRYFSIVKKSEEQRNEEKIDKEKFRETKAKAYLQIVIGILTITLLLCEWLLTIVTNNGEKIEIGILELNNTRMLLFLLFLAGMILFGIVAFRKKGHYRIFIGILTIFLFLIMTIDTLQNIVDLYPCNWTKLKTLMLLFSLFANIGTSLMVGHSYYINLISLRGLKKNQDISAIAVIIFCGCFSGAVLTTILVLMKIDWFIIGTSTFKVLISFVLIPIICAYAMQYEYQESNVVPNTPVGGVAQNGLTFSLCIIFASYLPCLYCSTIKEMNLDILIGLVGLITTAFLPVGFCLKNNVEHISKQFQVAKNNPEEMKKWESLHTCLVLQSKLAVFSMLPYVIVATAAQLGKIILKDRNLMNAKEILLGTYIDRKSYDSEQPKEDDSI